MWLSELVGRLQQRLHEEGDMRVKTKVRGIHFSDYDKNFVDVESLHLSWYTLRNETKKVK